MSSEGKTVSPSTILPPVLRPTEMERARNQELNTDILRPVNFNQKTTKFVFDKTGILDSNSQLQFAVTVENSTAVGVNTNAYFPTSTGCLSAISRAYLTIAGKVISDLRSLNHYSTWMRTHFSNEYKKGMLMPKQFGMDLFEGSTSRTILANGPTSIHSRGFSPPFGVLGRESSEYAISLVSATFGTQQAIETNTAERLSRVLTTDANTTPRVAVGLSQLIPFLKNLQLPLFAIEGEVAIVIEWAPNTVGHTFMVPPRDSAGNPIVATNCTSRIVQDAVLVMADYLYYPDQLVEEKEQIYSKGGYNIPFTDQFISENNTTFVDNTEQTKTMQLQLAGKKLKSLVIQKQVVDNANEYIENIGRYNSIAFKNGEALNLMINAKNFYARRISNPSLQKCEADLVHHRATNLCGARYSFDNLWDGANTRAVLGDRLVNGYANTVEQGASHWLGIKISNMYGEGKRISNVPIEYSELVSFETGADEEGNQRRYRFFCGIQKVLNISSGLAILVE